MTPPRWFWFVLAACVLAATGFYCWNVWHDNQPKPVAKTWSQMTDSERDAYRKAKQAEFRK